jgi:hypothetical protein
MFFISINERGLLPVPFTRIMLYRSTKCYIATSLNSSRFSCGNFTRVQPIPVGISEILTLTLTLFLSPTTVNKDIPIIWPELNAVYLSVHWNAKLDYLEAKTVSAAQMLSHASTMSSVCYSAGNSVTPPFPQTNPKRYHEINQPWLPSSHHVLLEANWSLLSLVFLTWLNFGALSLACYCNLHGD